MRTPVPEASQRNVAGADPPDAEGRIRISATVSGERLGQALSVVFAVRPDDEVPAARADPLTLDGKMPGQRDHITVGPRPGRSPNAMHDVPVVAHRHPTPSEPMAPPPAAATRPVEALLSDQALTSSSQLLRRVVARNEVRRQVRPSIMGQEVKEVLGERRWPRRRV
jgi:hypothetical protein